MRSHVSQLRLALGLGVLGVSTLVIFWGRGGSAAQATGNPPVAQAPVASEPAIPPAAVSDYSQRVVAYIFNTIPITREQLGEYLIARMGNDRVNSLVNRAIIDHICRQKGIEVTNAEVEADLAETLKGLGNISVSDFVNKVLRSYNKALTLYEWKEDVIRPRLLLTKLCRGRIHVTEEDLKMAFDAYHGEKVDCRIILWPKNEKHIAMNMYGKIRDNEKEFEQASTRQASPTLASTGGHIKPIGRNTTGNEMLEKAAFNLNPGELSQLIDTPEGPVVIKCLARIPPDKTKTLDQERDKLAKEVFDKKVQAEIPKIFAELKEQAQPKIFLKSGNLTEEELVRDVREELKSDPTKSPIGPKLPSGR